MSISLYNVKSFNNYTYVKTVAPTTAQKAPSYLASQTWINSTDGKSYMLVNDVLGTWNQIEMAEDIRITDQIKNTFNTVIKWINNIFDVERNEVYEGEYPEDSSKDSISLLYNTESLFSKIAFAATGKTLTLDPDELYGEIATFAVGDTIYVSGAKRNSGYLTITNIVGDVITVSETIKNDDSYCFLILCIIPDDLYNDVAKLINYDIFKRGAVTGLQSERIGSYSYTQGQSSTALNYPDELLSGIFTYYCPAIGGISYAVE